MNRTTIENAPSKLNFMISAFEVVMPIALFAVLTGAASLVRIPVPGTPVPVTLQSALVVMSGMFLGARKGALSQALYIVLGALGLPFFTTSVALVGPTGGYIFGFVLAAALSGLVMRRLQNSHGVTGQIKLYVGLLLASLGIFVPGVLWLKIMTQSSWTQAVLLGFTPFIIGDLIKTAIALTSYSVFRVVRDAARIRKKTVF